MKIQNRLLVVLLVLALSFGIFSTALAEDSAITLNTADCLEFFASEIVFTSEQVEVTGYFFNFSLNKTILSLAEVYMEIYDGDGKIICEGEFAELSDSLTNMQLYPGLSSRQRFLFTSARNPDNYNLADGFSVSFSCTFKSKDY